MTEDMILMSDIGLQHIITDDEMWVYEYDVLTAQQSTEWRFADEPKPKKPRQSRSKIKVMMLTVFFDSQGVVHSELLPESKSVNAQYYLSVLRRLRDSSKEATIVEE